MMNKKQPNLKNFVLLLFRGNLPATLLEGTLLASVKTQQDLGFVLSNKLTGSKKCSRTKIKPPFVFFQSKRSLTKRCTILTKSNACTGYVVPIATYPSPTWLPKRIQKIGTRCSFGPNRIYTERTAELRLFPHCLYVEMHDVLMLLALVDKKFNINIDQTTPETRDINRHTNGGELRLTTRRL